MFRRKVGEERRLTFYTLFFCFTRWMFYDVYIDVFTSDTNSNKIKFAVYKTASNGLQYFRGVIVFGHLFGDAENISSSILKHMWNRWYSYSILIFLFYYMFWLMSLCDDLMDKEFCRCNGLPGKTRIQRASEKSFPPVIHLHGRFWWSWTLAMDSLRCVVWL